MLCRAAGSAPVLVSICVLSLWDASINLFGTFMLLWQFALLMIQLPSGYLYLLLSNWCLRLFDPYFPDAYSATRDNAKVSEESGNSMASLKWTQSSLLQVRITWKAMWQVCNEKISPQIVKYFLLNFDFDFKFWFEFDHLTLSFNF